MIEDRHIAVCSERSLNLALSLITNAPNKKLEFPITHTYKNGNMDITYTGEWDEVCFLLLDFLNTQIIKEFYNKYNDGTIPTRPYKCKLVKAYSMKNMEDTNDTNKLKIRSIIIDEKTLRQYIQFKNIPIKKLRNSLDKLRDTKLTFEYGVRFLNEDGDYKCKNIEIRNDSVLHYDCISTNISPTGKIINKEYRIIFNSLLGKLMTYNCIMINYDWLTEDEYSFYKLKPKSQLFYRKYILPNRRDKFEKRFDDCNKMLNFGSRKEYYKKDIIKCLNDMKENNLIESFDIGINIFSVVLKK